MMVEYGREKVFLVGVFGKILRKIFDWSWIKKYGDRIYFSGGK